MRCSQGQTCWVSVARHVAWRGPHTPRGAATRSAPVQPQPTPSQPPRHKPAPSHLSALCWFRPLDLAAAGMIMWQKAKRAVSADTARAIAAVARGAGAKAVGVFVDEDAATISAR